MTIPTTTSNPKVADAIEAAGQVFEYVKQTPETACTDRCKLARPDETLSLKCVVGCRLEMA